jgi:hypothetical protein
MNQTDNNAQYCERLVDVAFPDEVEIGGEKFIRDTLSQRLPNDPELQGKALEKIGFIFLLSKKGIDLVGMLVEELFPDEATKTKLREEIKTDPKLQQGLAARSAYVPSKWLLEQEMKAKGEWDEVSKRDIYEFVAEKGLTGVCFSGGGIRSATFNLGVIQGLAQLGLLKHIDYLSSVSGGGYIHGFLAGWILRNGSIDSVVKELIPQAEPGCLPRAPEPIQWLKKYASYLTPRRGPFSADTWTAFAIWLRNTILNQVPILAAFACGFFFLHLLVPQPIEGWLPIAPRGLEAECWWLGTVLLAWPIFSVLRLWLNLHLQEERARIETSSPMYLMTNRSVVVWLILPWLGCSVWVTYWLQMHLNVLDSWRHGWGSWPDWWPIALLCALILWMVEVVIFAGGAMRAYEGMNPNAGRRRKAWAGFGFFLGGVAATAVAAAIGWATVKETWWASESLRDWVQVAGLLKALAPVVAVDPWRIRLVILPALLLSVPYVAIELTLGFLGRDYQSIRHEWLARFRAWSMLYAIFWVSIVGLVLGGPYVGYYIAGNRAWLWSSLSAFVVAHGATILAGWSGKADGKPTANGILGFKPMDLVGVVAAPVAIVSMLLLISFGTSVGVDKLTCWMAQCPLTLGSKWQPFVGADFMCLIAAGSIAALMGWRIDINEFSMHRFYRNRLSRCYLGATVPGKRQPDPFTGFDDRGKAPRPGEESRRVSPRLLDLLPMKYRIVREKDAKKPEGNYDGPFPVFCATLNLTTGYDLATQERKGTSFAFTPLFSGYSVVWTDGERDGKVSYNGYVPTDEYAYQDGGVHLGSAVAISGAALNPNQGYNSNPALAFLMTFFNVRLGWWISNTRRTDAWRASRGRSTPGFALISLFQELFGTVGDGAKYVNLSDGGHFENMGLYELVRRRCKYIIVSDAEEDSQMKFEGIGGAITKCRADFGAEIDLDLRPLQIQEDTGFSNAHCVVGTIRYPAPPGFVTAAKASTACECLGDSRSDDYMGVIVYMKSSLVGDEPADLLTHKLKCAEFPQDPTANQWFAETIFEAYRRLGHHIAMTTIQPALSPKETRIAPSARNEIPELFRMMEAIWYPRTPEMEKSFGDHLSQYEGILKDLRERPELSKLEECLNDPRETGDLPKKPVPGGNPGAPVRPCVEWAPPQTPPDSKLYAVKFAVSVVDFMYAVYTDLRLAFPENRVSPHAQWWICLFRRWCRVDLVQEAWLKHDKVYSEDFCLFARRELELP